MIEAPSCVCAPHQSCMSTGTRLPAEQVEDDTNQLGDDERAREGIREKAQRHLAVRPCGTVAIEERAPLLLECFEPPFVACDLFQSGLLLAVQGVDLYSACTLIERTQIPHRQLAVAVMEVVNESVLVREPRVPFDGAGELQWPRLYP